jgi:pentatricopeptide repeat protein
MWVGWGSVVRALARCGELRTALEVWNEAVAKGYAEHRFPLLQLLAVCDQVRL